MNDLNAKEVSDICVACGMCCDGTLFMKANLSNPKFNDVPENVVKAHNLNMNVFEENDKFFFKLPCHLFDKCCSVYDKVRPRVCGTFFCDPLKKYENGDLSLDMASKLINQTLDSKSNILKTAQEFPEFKNQIFLEIIEYLNPILEKSSPTDLKKYGKLILLIINFRKLKKQIISMPK